MAQETPEAAGVFDRNTLKAAVDSLFDPKERARLMKQRALNEIALTKQLYGEDYYMNGSSSDAPKIRYQWCSSNEPHPAHYWSVDSGFTVAEHCDDNTPRCWGRKMPGDLDRMVDAQKALVTEGGTRDAVVINSYPETVNSPDIRKTLIDQIEREAVERAFRAKAAEMRTRFEHTSVFDPNSFAHGWLEAVNYFDPDHTEV